MLGLDHLEIMRDRRRLGEHRRGGTVFLDRQVDGARHLGLGKRPALDDEVHMDAGEHFRLGLGPVGIHLDDAVLDRLAALFEDVHDVIGRAAAGADQHQYHGARSRFWLSVGAGNSPDHFVPGAGFTDKGPVLDPFYTRFHQSISNSYCICPQPPAGCSAVTRKISLDLADCARHLHVSSADPAHSHRRVGRSQVGFHVSLNQNRAEAVGRRPVRRFTPRPRTHCARRIVLARRQRWPCRSWPTGSRR